MPKVAITQMSPHMLKELLASWGEPAYRAAQILDWVYRKPMSGFSGMVNLPSRLRERLEGEFLSQSITPEATITSSRGTTKKTLFRLGDARTIEAVLMLYQNRRTVCVSSQVGCAFGCPLCATGASGFERNLTTAEITDQVLHFSRQLAADNLRLSNIVFMGMGEPLANLEPVWRAIERFASPDLLGLGARHITISTVGIPSGIKKLAQSQLQVGLAVSLHAPNDTLRDTLVPINRLYPLTDLLPACRSYVQATNRRISFEYALIDGTNDSVQLAVELGDLLRGLNCYVNLIPANPSAASDFRPPHRARIQAFSDTLTRHHIPNAVRLAMGVDVEAGCGQLRARLTRDVA